MNKSWSLDLSSLLGDPGICRSTLKSNYLEGDNDNKGINRKL